MTAQKTHLTWWKVNSLHFEGVQLYYTICSGEKQDGAQDMQLQLWAKVASLEADGWMLEILMSTNIKFTNEVSAYLAISISRESSLQDS